MLSVKEIKEKFKPGTKIEWNEVYDFYKGTYIHRKGIVVSTDKKNIEFEIGGLRDWRHIDDMKGLKIVKEYE